MYNAVDNEVDSSQVDHVPISSLISQAPVRITLTEIHDASEDSGTVDPQVRANKLPICRYEDTKLCVEGLNADVMRSGEQCE